MNEPKGYFKCSCGAITIVMDDGNEYSCKQTNLRKYFPNIDLRKLTKYQETYCCNHCANRYGLDLCGCGSGEEYGRCENGLEECDRPMQVIGKYTRVVASNAWG